MHRILVVALALPALAHAGDATVDDVVKAVEKRYTDVQAISASFTQTTSSEIYGASTQTGTMTLERPTKMRWDFDDGKRYVTDGKTMWIMNPAEKQVMQMTDIAASAGAADSVLQSLDKVSQIFSVEILEDSADTRHLKLTPRQPSDTLKHIELSLDPGDLDLQKVTILDAFDSRTELAFADLKTSASRVDPQTFSFTVPEGYEVLKN